jgi:Phosphoribosylpyrophosphate synthetase
MVKGIGFKYTKFNFPCGETQIIVDRQFKGMPFDPKWTAIKFSYENDAELIELLLLADAYKRVAGELPRVLYIGYMPYSRQDRVMAPGEALSIKVICGDEGVPGKIMGTKGAMQHLWDTFGGTVNSKGYKQLDPHVGLIYGDSITLVRCRAISDGLKRLGFASTNIVYGIGSYTYQYNTRDIFGFAVKATYGVVNGEGRAIYKDPVTDDGEKKSARGLLSVTYNDLDYKLCEDVTPELEGQGSLKTVFKDGQLVQKTTLAEIRERLKASLYEAFIGGTR